MNLPKPTDTQLSNLVAYPGNARIHDTRAIAASLKANGQYRPIVVQKSTRYVLAGNGTVAAATELGWDTVAAQVIDVDDDTARRIVLADNRTSDLATYDSEALAALLNDTDDLAGTGFDFDAVVPTGSDTDSELPEFERVDMTEDTDYRCPKCQYEWNGKPR
jgi:hypothetical protein